MIETDDDDDDDNDNDDDNYDDNYDDNDDDNDGDYRDFSMLWRAVAVSWHSGASTECARALKLDYQDDDDDDDCDDLKKHMRKKHSD